MFGDGCRDLRRGSSSLVNISEICNVRIFIFGDSFGDSGCAPSFLATVSETCGVHLHFGRSIQRCGMRVLMWGSVLRCRARVLTFGECFKELRRHLHCWSMFQTFVVCILSFGDCVKDLEPAPSCVENISKIWRAHLHFWRLLLRKTVCILIFRLGVCLFMFCDCFRTCGVCQLFTVVERFRRLGVAPGFRHLRAFRSLHRTRKVMWREPDPESDFPKVPPRSTLDCIVPSGP